MKPYIVGVAGGSASGKTEIVKTLKKHFEDKIEIIEHDNYYFRSWWFDNGRTREFELRSSAIFWNGFIDWTR